MTATSTMEYRLRPASQSDKGFLFQLHGLTMRGHIESTWGWDDAWQRRGIGSAVLWQVMRDASMSALGVELGIAH
ncbi:MAG: hypothetical protein A3G25_14900 [Betaproteobacteria bacterium RIFCSPLOWO2_12_FULL_63_13]|nr:MAG: hypothetical protein A3G25_14900 [Betaproteobacteria bacterium RIFCSPLOWO2_12_FULL_63_13]